MNTKLTSDKKVFGTICGILAAVFYGTNPLGALKLYEQGMNTNSVFFSRFFDDALFQLPLHRGRRRLDAVVHLSHHDSRYNGRVFQGESRYRVDSQCGDYHRISA